MRLSSTFTAGRLALGLLVSLAVGGCGGSTTYTYDGPTGQVSGKVTYKGQPVTEGQIIFQTIHGGAVGQLGEGGAYSLSFKGQPAIPVGQHKVSIKPPKGPPVVGEDAPVTVKHPMIPDQYQLTSTSDLTASVKEGENTLDFDME